MVKTKPLLEDLDAIYESEEADVAQESEASPPVLARMVSQTSAT